MEVIIKITLSKGVGTYGSNGMHAEDIIDLMHKEIEYCMRTFDPKAKVEVLSIK